MITVILADDHTVVRNGLRLLLNAQPDIEVMGEAATGREAVQLAAKLQPQIALLDIAMPDLNGIEATRQIGEVAPTTQVIILSMHAGSDYIYHALQAGARGYILKESAAEELIQAIYAVQSGNRFLNSKVTDEIVTHYLGQGATAVQESPLTQLSDREREVLQLVVEGKTSVEVGAILALSPKTVDTYRSRLMQKLNIHDLPTLVKFAIQQGITGL
ncbi:MAG: response regulator transcription factor [Caldilineaceae bacterium]